MLSMQRPPHNLSERWRAFVLDYKERRNKENTQRHSQCFHLIPQNKVLFGVCHAYKTKTGTTKTGTDAKYSGY